MFAVVFGKKYAKTNYQPSRCELEFKTIVIMHQLIPPASSSPPPPPGLIPRHWHSFCLGWQMPGDGDLILSCQFPRGGDKKRGQMPRPPSTLQHFSLIAQSNSSISSILMCDFLFQLTSSFVIALGF